MRPCYEHYALGGIRTRDHEGTIMAMPMADEDGDWKVASLAGTPLS